MRNEMPNRFKSCIQERPDNIQERTYSVHSEKYDDLAATLKLMEASKSIVLDQEEVVALFGKGWKLSIKKNLKKRGVEKPRLGSKGNSVHIWSTKV